MHEMSIALNIIDIVRENALKSDAEIVTEVELEIGTIAGIEYDALEFAFETAKIGTIMENAKLVIHRTPPVAKCSSCDNTFETNNIFTECPNCSEHKLDFISGRELRVKSINIE